MRKDLDNLRRNAVKKAWERERELVLQGRGTRDWTVGQQAELIQTGKVHGFEGQHMKNVADYPEYADNPDNIQFLTYEEHFYGAHKGNFHNETNGRFDPKTGEMVETEGKEIPSQPEIELTDRYDPSQYKVLSEWDPEFGYQPHEGYKNSKELHKEEKSNKNFGRVKESNDYVGTVSEETNSKTNEYVSGMDGTSKISDSMSNEYTGTIETQSESGISSTEGSQGAERSAGME